MRGPCTIIQAVSTHMSTNMSFGLLVCLLIFRLKKRVWKTHKKIRFLLSCCRLCMNVIPITLVFRRAMQVVLCTGAWLRSGWAFIHTSRVLAQAASAQKKECVHVCFITQACLTLCNPLDYSPPGFSVHGILQARILEWVAIPFSRGSSQPRD